MPIATDKSQQLCTVIIDVARPPGWDNNIDVQVECASYAPWSYFLRGIVHFTNLTLIDWSVSWIHVPWYIKILPYHTTHLKILEDQILKGKFSVIKQMYIYIYSETWKQRSPLGPKTCGIRWQMVFLFRLFNTKHEEIV